MAGAVFLNSTKKRSVVGSTTIAEYIALSMTSRQVVSSIEGTPEELAVPLKFGVNNASLQLSKGVSNTPKIKHFDTSFPQIVDEVKKGSIKLFWVLEKKCL